MNDPRNAISNAYVKTDKAILSTNSDLSRGGSTAVTAIIFNGRKLWVANLGDSRAVLSKRGQALQMSVDHEPSTERGSIEDKGGFVSNLPDALVRANARNSRFYHPWYSLNGALQTSVSKMETES
ncbi:putative protein phosphatase 2C 9 [Silene latifolia]|uniref:putative protein phosphatase 2C 9 n=1 Tax=Silene latifolia TaxID=37657 RepID=UPI003D770A2C